MLLCYLNRCQYKCVGAHRACKSKVAESHHTPFAEQNILRFHIPVQNPVSVQIKQGRH